MVVGKRTRYMTEHELPPFRLSTIHFRAFQQHHSKYSVDITHVAGTSEPEYQLTGIDETPHQTNVHAHSYCLFPRGCPVSTPIPPPSHPENFS